MKFNNKGFSLLDLMIVVSIMGLLATMAVPRFQSFQARARMTEAKIMLNHIYTLEESYFIESNSYSSTGAPANDGNWYGYILNTGVQSCSNAGYFATIGFAVVPCDNKSPRFAYYISTVGVGYNAVANSGYSAGNRVNTGAAAAQKFSVNQSKVITELCNTITGLRPTGAACAAASTTD